jgi:hypothetical protein
MKRVGHVAHISKITNTRAIQKVTSYEMSTKQKMWEKKKLLYVKIHILKLLLNIVSGPSV